MKQFLYFIWTIGSLHSNAQTSSWETFELQKLKNRFSSSLIVGLGEVGHGFESINEAKSSLVDLLQSEMNFEAIAFESSFTESVVSFIRDSTLESRTKNFLYPFWNTPSVRKTLKSFFDKETSLRPLIIGFDIQEDCRFTKLSQLLIEKQLILTNRDKLLESDSLLSYYIGKHFTRKHALSHQEYLLLVENYEIIVKEIRAKQQSVLQYKLLERSIENRKWLCKLLTLTTAKERMYFRDSLMADNVRWIHNELYPNNKLILWAANTHISNNVSNKEPQWMAEWLSSQYSDNYFSIAFNKGSGNKFLILSKTSYSYYESPSGKFNLVIYLDKLKKIKPDEWNTPCEDR